MGDDGGSCWLVDCVEARRLSSVYRSRGIFENVAKYKFQKDGGGKKDLKQISIANPARKGP